jgi:hypothetical protein
LPGLWTGIPAAPAGLLAGGAVLRRDGDPARSLRRHKGKTVSECLYRVVAPHFVCGLIVRGGRVVRCAPIVRWAAGKAWLEVWEYFRRKGYGVERVGK